MSAASPAMQAYFKRMEDEIEIAYALATKARAKGYDPEPKVDIPLARNMAERVEGLISIVAPQLVGKGIIERIQDLEKQYGILDWRVALTIALEVAQEKFCTFSSKKEALEVGIRTGFAYHTLGIVAAPLEGFIELDIKKRRDGKEYLSPKYAGPVRGAGGTAAAFSVILTDYIRVKMGYSPYDPDDNEVSRYATEIRDYHERVSNLQYYPSEEEIKFLASHIPVEVGGDPTEVYEVSQYKDLPRVDTNMIRGGVCLVIAEGVAQKAPKLWLRLSKWGKEFSLEWDWLNEFITIQKRIKAQLGDKTKVKTDQKLTPNYTYIKDLVAGRPVLTHPMRVGGFRLRYGRTRVNGYSACSIHPATQYVLDKYIAIGTQLKVERPGKAAAVTVCDSIDGPIVLLEDGAVTQLNTLKEYRDCKDKIKEIIYLGDILFNYGDFSENNHILVPPGYCEEWWLKELERSMVNMFGTIDIEKLADATEIPKHEIERMMEWPTRNLDPLVCISLAQKTSTPLHPACTSYWKSITAQDLLALAVWISKGNLVTESGAPQKLVLPLTKEGKLILETLGLPHQVIAGEFIVIDKAHTVILAHAHCLAPEKAAALFGLITENLDKDALTVLNMFSTVKVMDKGGTFIGARMGRPEKAKMRKLIGSPQVLFPVGEEGGRLRSIQAALESGTITADFPLYQCTQCGTQTIFSVCHNCEIPAQRKYQCVECGQIDVPICPKHGPAKPYLRRAIDINSYFSSSLKHLGISTYPDLIKGVRGTSNKEHVPEHLVKGILRAKHDVYVNKDGTTRYDMSELPITHFKPREIGTSVQKLREIGYEHDIAGKPLEDDNQVLEIKPQDVILPGNPNAPDESANVVLLRVAAYIDELLTTFYGLPSYYNLKTSEDLVGHLVIGLAPHISAGMIGRIIGFAQAQGCYAHPLWHAALRRDCDGDECCVIMLMDSLLNFSRKFLPDKRGGRTMDAPLVLTTRVIPSEVDDMAQGLDVVWSYPLEFYEAALQYKKPDDIKIEQIEHRLNTVLQYESMGFTHKTSNINQGVKCSAYKILPSMEEKLRGQMLIAERVRAVDEADVATLVIEKHFIKDIRGNLRKFSMQQFRCVKCNEKFRRPPLVGKCTKCGGKIIFTISEGSVVKYLEPSISIAAKYNLPAYLRQSLDLTKRRIDAVFGKEREKQQGLGQWF